MIAEARRLLRITSSAFDGEIQGLLDAAALDLQMAGVAADRIIEADALVGRALLTYVKAHFGWDNADHERLISAYTNIKQHLLLSGEYTNEVK